MKQVIATVASNSLTIFFFYYKIFTKKWEDPNSSVQKYLFIIHLILLIIILSIRLRGASAVQAPVIEPIIPKQPCMRMSSFI